MITYITPSSDAKPLITIPKGQVDTSTSITLFGDGSLDYSQLLWQNFLHILENFSNDVPPTNPTSGQIWFSIADDTLRVFDGSQWLIVGAPIISTLPPADNDGGLWFDTLDQQLKYFDGAVWQSVAIRYLHRMDGGTVTGTLQSSVESPDQSIIFDGALIQFNGKLHTQLTVSSQLQAPVIRTVSSSSVLDLSGADLSLNCNHPVKLIGTNTLTFSIDDVEKMRCESSTIDLFAEMSLVGAAVAVPPAGDLSSPINHNQLNALVNNITSTYLRVDGSNALTGGVLHIPSLVTNSIAPEFVKERTSGRTWKLNSTATPASGFISLTADSVQLMGADASTSTITLNSVIMTYKPIVGIATTSVPTDAIPRKGVLDRANEIGANVSQSAPYAHGRITGAGALQVQTSNNILAVTRLSGTRYRVWFNTPVSGPYDVVIGSVFSPLLTGSDPYFNPTTEPTYWEVRSRDHTPQSFIINLYAKVGHYNSGGRDSDDNIRNFRFRQVEFYDPNIRINFMVIADV